MREQVLKYTTSNSIGVGIMQWSATFFTVVAIVEGFAAKYWLLSLFVYFCTGCLGITVTFHRYLSHRSFKMPKYLEYLFSFFGAMGGTGSSLGWTAVHREHHEYTDRPQDPHSPANGKWAIIFSRYNFVMNKWSVRDLVTEPFHKNLHLWYHAVVMLWALLWLSCGFQYFLFIVAVPICIQIWVSVLSNIINHWGGYRNFETTEKSTNNILVALVSWGEGWHNNHHRYPGRWNFQIKWWELDISSWIIRLVRTNG